MGTKRQTEKKKNSRIKKGRSRTMSKRHKLREIMRDERKSALLEKKFRSKISPIANNPERKAIMDQVEKNKTMEKLKRNAEILKALEDEYESQMEFRRTFNESLESDGHETLKDKFSALEKSARDIVNGTSEFIN